MILKLTAALAVVAAFATTALADPVAGHKKAAQCQVCHGYDGIGTNPEVPHIAGESEIYLMAKLRAFRSGERQHRQMSLIAQNLTDADIRDLADYYASIEITVTVPEY